MVSPPHYPDHDDGNYRQRYQRAFSPYMTIPDFQETRDNRVYVSNRTTRTGVPNDPPAERAEPPTRKRIAVACGRCRKRKIRCSGDYGQNQPCSNCRNAGISQCLFLRVSSRETPIKTNASPTSQGNDFEYNMVLSRAMATRSAVPPPSYAPMDFPVNEGHLRSTGFYPGTAPAANATTADAATGRPYYSPVATPWNGGSYEQEYVGYSLSASAPAAYTVVDPGPSAGLAAPYHGLPQNGGRMKPLAPAATVSATAVDTTATMVPGSRGSSSGTGALDLPKGAGTSNHGTLMDNNGHAVSGGHGATTSLAHRPAPTAHETASSLVRGSGGVDTNAGYAVTDHRVHAESGTGALSAAASYVKAETGSHAEALAVAQHHHHHMAVAAHGIPAAAHHQHHHQHHHHHGLAPAHDLHGHNGGTAYGDHHGGGSGLSQRTPPPHQSSSTIAYTTTTRDAVGGRNQAHEAVGTVDHSQQEPNTTLLHGRGSNSNGNGGSHHHHHQQQQHHHHHHHRVYSSPSSSRDKDLQLHHRASQELVSQAQAQPVAAPSAVFDGGAHAGYGMAESFSQSMAAAVAAATPSALDGYNGYKPAAAVSANPPADTAVVVHHHKVPSSKHAASSSAASTASSASSAASSASVSSSSSSTTSTTPAAVPTHRTLYGQADGTGLDGGDQHRAYHGTLPAGGAVDDTATTKHAYKNGRSQ